MIIRKHNYWILALSFLYFILSYSFALSWYKSGYFAALDILFDADPFTNIASIANGWGRHAMSHAFLETFSLPIRIIEYFVSKAGLISDKVEFRKLIALSISPIFSSLTLIVFYKILLQLKAQRVEAHIFTAMFAASFTNIMFSIIPETYAVSCFLISLLIFYYYKCGETKDSNPIIWLILAILLTGITITNICIFFLVYSLHLYRHKQANYINILKKSILYSVAALLFVLIFYKASHFLLDYNTGNTAGGIDWIKRYTTQSFYQLGINFINFFSSSINSFVALSPIVLPNENCVEFQCNKLSFIRHESNYLWLSFVILCFTLLIFFSKNHIREKKWHDLYLISSLIIIFNLFLHMLFGRELFMYSQHWIIALFLLLLPILTGRRLVSIIFLGIMLGINIHFFINIEQMIALK